MSWVNVLRKWEVIILIGQDKGSGFLINEKLRRAIKALLIKKNEGAEEVQISG